MDPENKSLHDVWNHNVKRKTEKSKAFKMIKKSFGNI